LAQLFSVDEDPFSGFFDILEPFASEDCQDATQAHEAVVTFFAFQAVTRFHDTVVVFIRVSLKT
jgi:hypothetical protein